jgi:hypothetical protein
MTPILPPAKAISDEMSSDFTEVPVTLGTKAVFQTASLQTGLQTVAFTQTLPPCVHVAQSCPVESFAITSVSVLKLLIETGKPASRVYVSSRCS